MATFPWLEEHLTNWWNDTSSTYHNVEIIWRFVLSSLNPGLNITKEKLDFSFLDNINRKKSNYLEFHSVYRENKRSNMISFGSSCVYSSWHGLHLFPCLSTKGWFNMGLFLFHMKDLFGALLLKPIKWGKFWNLYLEDSAPMADELRANCKLIGHLFESYCCCVSSWFTNTHTVGLEFTWQGWVQCGPALKGFLRYKNKT